MGVRHNLDPLPNPLAQLAAQPWSSRGQDLREQNWGEGRGGGKEPTYYSHGRGRIPKCSGFPRCSPSQQGRLAHSASPAGTEALKTDSKFTGFFKLVSVRFLCV